MIYSFPYCCRPRKWLKPHPDEVALAESEEFFQRAVRAQDERDRHIRAAMKFKSN
jgi:hypothetical protein